MKKKIIAIILFLIAGVITVYTQLTIFVVPPIGAVPEGGIVVMLRLNNTEFIDSPDAICERIQGGVNLLCRGMTLVAVSTHSTILFRLPYSESMYLLSTSGKSYLN